jgi:NAD(P)H-flavin reductase
VFQTYKTKLILKQQLTPNVFLFRFELVDPLQINFQAGQYLMIKINEQSRLYSICSPSGETRYFELIIQLIPDGIASEYFKNLNIGDPVEFQGSAGAFILRENNRNKIFLATGTGIAPIRSIINKCQMLNIKCQNYLFWGLKTFQDVYLFDELKQITNTNSNFHFQICLSREADLLKIPENDRKYFFLGHIDPTSSRLRGAGVLHGSDYYICGSRTVVESLQTKLLEIGVQKENIIIEKF